MERGLGGPPPDPPRRHLISDNASGVHPEVLGMIAQANAGHAVAYGEDPITEHARTLFRQHFGDSALTYFVSTGTAANVLALASVTRSFQAVIGADASHLHRDECGAPEKFLGSKLLAAPAVEGKLTVGTIEPLVRDTRDVHRARPRVLSISQPTELGTIYTPDEIRALADYCHHHDLWLHVDGARLSNATVALGLTLRQATTDLGVDLLSFGGTKNGMLAAEAAVFLNPACGGDARFFQKQTMQLLSKMRFAAAQFIAFLRSDLWAQNARHANAMATLLASEVAKVSAVELAVPQQTNAVFARIPEAWVGPLQQVCRFHVWDRVTTTVRWMTSFDTTADDVHRFVTALQEQDAT